MPLSEQSEKVAEHGRRLDTHDERLNIHATRFERLELVLEGDEKMGVRGLVQHMAEMNNTLKGLVEWRNELVIYARAIKFGGRIALVLLGLIVGGVWWPSLWPQAQVFIKFVGG